MPYKAPKWDCAGKKDPVKYPGACPDKSVCVNCMCTGKYAPPPVKPAPCPTKKPTPMPVVPAPPTPKPTKKPSTPKPVAIATPKPTKKPVVPAVCGDGKITPPEKCECINKYAGMPYKAPKWDCAGKKDPVKYPGACPYKTSCANCQCTGKYIPPVV
ncbi:unnamed protein product [Phaeothamnion confervicola]